MNEIVFGESENDAGGLLQLPPWMAPSNAAKIRSLIPQHVASIPPTLLDTIRSLLRPILGAPLRPIWACPDEDGTVEWFGEGVDEMLEHQLQSQSGFDDTEYNGAAAAVTIPFSNGSSSSTIESTQNDDSPHSTKSGPFKGLSFIPLILLSCSAVKSDALHAQWHSWKYIQGAGDDEENWCMGLTADLFWKHKDDILSSDDPYEVSYSQYSNSTYKLTVHNHYNYTVRCFATNNNPTY
jgi:tRNA A64-2'-O-ribosylphosphate transferase